MEADAYLAIETIARHAANSPNISKRAYRKGSEDTHKTPIFIGVYSFFSEKMFKFLINAV